MSDITLIHPVNPKYVRVTAEWGSYPGHKGRDYGWILLLPLASKEVRAAAPGRVVHVYRGGGYNEGWGNQVIIQHTDEAWSTYNHFKNGGISVEEGEVVGAGDLLGRMGNTGDTRGVHLHFEVRIGGIGEGHRVNPATYFTKPLPGVAVVGGSVAGGTGERFTKRQITTTAVHVRKSPNGPIIKTLKKGTLVKTSGRVAGVWARMRRLPTYGWIHREFIVPQALHTTADLNLRSLPSTRGAIVTTIPKGSKVRFIASETKTENADWYKIQYGRKKGWAATAYLK